MQGYFAAATIVLMLGMVLTRALMLPQSCCFIAKCCVRRGSSRSITAKSMQRIVGMCGATSSAQLLCFQGKGPFDVTTKPRDTHEA